MESNLVGGWDVLSLTASWLVHILPGTRLSRSNNEGIHHCRKLKHEKEPRTNLLTRKKGTRWQEKCALSQNSAKGQTLHFMRSPKFPQYQQTYPLSLATNWCQSLLMLGKGQQMRVTPSQLSQISRCHRYIHQRDKMSVIDSRLVLKILRHQF
jgi:hypothetical protein